MSAITEYITKDQWTNYIDNISGNEIELELSGLNLTDSNIVGLAEALKNNTSITRLDLTKNKITDIGARALASALLENQKIATDPMGDTGVISLNDNSMGKEGVLALIKALYQSNRAIWTTSFAENGLTEEDMNEIAKHPEFQALIQQQEQFRTNMYGNSGDCVIS